MSKTYRDIKGLMSAVNVTRPEWAAQIGVGDEVTIKAPPDSEHRTYEVAGFSTHERYHGQPAIVADSHLQAQYDETVDIICLTEDDIVEHREVAHADA